MRAVTSCCITLLLIGCGKPADKPEDTTVGEAPAMEQAAPAGISLADLAGTWNVRAALDGSDKSITYDLVTTKDGSGSTLKFPGRDPIPLRVVATEGDSIVWEAGPFESASGRGYRSGSPGPWPGCRTASWSARRPPRTSGRVRIRWRHLTLEGTRAP